VALSATEGYDQERHAQEIEASGEGDAIDALPFIIGINLGYPN
jgi:hypothetical protein